MNRGMKGRPHQHIWFFVRSVDLNNQITCLKTSQSVGTGDPRSSRTDAKLDVPHGPRVNGKGFLRLSLVTCPVVTSESEKISFNQLNRQTSHRIKYLKVDSETGGEVANKDIVNAYALDRETLWSSSRRPD
jgi:hypothetical protein